MSRCHVRCCNSKCQTRRVLKAKPDLMRRLPKCTGCGGTKYRIDWWMNGRDTRAMGCSCAGYVHLTGRAQWTIHRKGSPYCWFRKDGTQRMQGDPDFKDSLQEQHEAALAA